MTSLVERQRARHRRPGGTGRTPDPAETRRKYGFWRSILLIGSISMFAWGGYLRLQPARDDAPVIDVAEALRVLEGKGATAVRLRAEPDEERVLYPTGLSEPPFAACHPDHVRRLRSHVEISADGWIGCRVRVEAHLASDRYALVPSIGATGPGAEASVRRFVAPVQGSEGAVWALSPPVESGSQQEYDWLEGIVFEGRLLPLAAVAQHLPGGFSLDQVAVAYTQHRQMPLPKQSWALVPAEDTHFQALARKGARAYAPLRGSGRRLFLELDGRGLALPAVLEGKLALARGPLGATLAALTRTDREQNSEEDPPRLGILHLSRPPSPETMAERYASLGLLVAGMLCFMWVMRRLPKKRL